MKRSVLLLTIAATAACVLPVFAGCGGGTSSNNSSGDDGGSDASGMQMDASHKDSSAFADAPGDDGGLPEGAVPPSGKQLVSSTSVQIDGVTSDGLAVYTDFSNSTVNAVPVAGGTPTMIGMDDGSGVVAAGPVVLHWTGATSGVGQFAVWSQAHGNQMLGTAVPPGAPGQGILDLSTDGAHVLYFDNVTATTADVFVAETQGGTPVKIVPGVRIDNQQCPPEIAIAGAYAVVAYCTTAASDAGAGDGGIAPIATLATFTGSNWGTTATLSTAASPIFVHDAAGTQLLYTTSAGLVVTKLATGTTATIDAAGTAGVFTSDGSKVIYVTSAGAVFVSPSAGGSAPTMLASGGFQGLVALSPDDKWALAYEQINAQSGMTDMYLVSTTTPGTPVTLVSSTGATLYGDAFTADSSHALYYQNIVMDVGDFMAAPTSGGMPAKLGSKVWLNLAATGAKVLYNDNYAAGAMGATGTADIELADTSQAGAPKLLVTQADAYFYLTAAKDTVVYSWSFVTDQRAGIWATPAQ